MAAGPQALKQLLKDIEQLEVWWYRITQTLTEQGFIAPENAWEPDWAPWEESTKERIQERIDDWGKPNPVTGA